MAQGLLKKATKPSGKKASQSSGILKKGARTFAPKNAKLQKQAKLNKKFTSGLTAQTEAMLGQRVGHLELLGQKKKAEQKGKDGAKKGGAGKKS